MRNLSVESSKCTFEIRSHSAFANALRRTLMMDVSRHAPSHVKIIQNKSSQTDEYIAHRIGLIPFDVLDDQETPLTLHVKGREAFAHDLVGTSFRATQNVPVVLLSQTQELNIVVYFKRGTASEHARFAMIGPVSYKIKEAEQCTELSFEMINKEQPLTYLLDALLNLQAKIEASELFIEKQYDNKRRLLTEKK